MLAQPDVIRIVNPSKSLQLQKSADNGNGFSRFMD